MITFGLLSWMLCVGQAPERPGWQLAPQLFQGLELVYSGTYTEEALIPGVFFHRTYRLDNTILVLDATRDHWEVSILTVLGLRSPRAEPGAKETKAAPSSVRMALAQVDRKGRIKGLQGKDLALPLMGPPTLETGALLELPGFPIAVHQTWEVGEEGRPPQSWQVVGTEACNGVTCLKLQGQQQSEDWDRPRADHTAWRRRDVIWLAPHLGIAYRVERTLERREPARRDPTHRTLVRYELDSRLKYPGKLFDDRLEEIKKYQRFQEEAAPLLPQPLLYRSQIDGLLRKIAYHCENNSATPYRQALLRLQARLEQARRGEMVAEAPVPEPVSLIPTVHLGQRAPDFLVTNLIDRQSFRLYRFLGRPILIAFFNPDSKSGKQVLLFAKKLKGQHGNNLAVLALAVTSNAELVRRQHAELKLPFPILDGGGLHRTFAVDATPRLILLDAEGIMRAAHTGWGFQVPGEIEAELQNWLPRPGN